MKCFYGSPSTYLWEDEMGVTQTIPQGEGREQGTRSCPCCTHWATRSVAFRASEIGRGRVRVRLDDIHTVTRPANVDVAHVVVEEELWSHAPMARRKVWNRGGIEPSCVG